MRRRLARLGSMVVRRQIHVPDDVLPFELDIHRPGSEIHFPLDFAGNNPLLRRIPSFIPIAGLEMAFIPEHDLLAADLHCLTALGCVLGKAGIGVGDRYTGGRSAEHKSELQSLMRISYAIFSLKKK